MSNSAKGLLALTILSAMLTFALPEEVAGHLPMIVCGTCFGLFLLALLIGRKIKFDPILR